MATRMGKTPDNLAKAAARAARAVDRQGTDERAKKRRRDRNVSLIHQGDAMSTLLAQLPCEVASAIYASLDQAAAAEAGQDPHPGAVAGGHPGRAAARRGERRFGSQADDLRVCRPRDPGRIERGRRVPARVRGHPGLAGPRHRHRPQLDLDPAEHRPRHRPAALRRAHQIPPARRPGRLHPGPGENLRIPRLQPTRRILRPRPHPRLAPRRPHRRRGPARQMPSSSPVERRTRWRYTTGPGGVTIINTPTGRTHIHRPDPSTNPDHSTTIHRRSETWQRPLWTVSDLADLGYRAPAGTRRHRQVRCRRAAPWTIARGSTSTG